VHCGARVGGCPYGPSDGENYYDAAASNAPDANCTSAVAAWYGEITNYNFSSGAAIDPTMDIGHYTQIVWAGTTLVGCASIQCQVPETTTGTDIFYDTFILCRYSPAGNCAGPGTTNAIPYTPSCNCGTVCASPNACAADVYPCPAAGVGSDASSCAQNAGSPCSLDKECCSGHCSAGAVGKVC